jgi:p-aminobenzoyl-glutamate transporter AbgT
MITLLSPHYVLQAVTKDDMVIASVAGGFTIGFGWLTTWTAIKQTRHIYKRVGLKVFRNAYVWMIWLEILVCLIFAVICWLYLRGVIPPRLGYISPL